MTSRNYGACLAHVFKWEGGYVNHPKDPGGATNFGITIATLSNHRGQPVSVSDVKELTHAEAGEIYRPKYWDTVRGNDLPDGLDLVAFDAGVNSGPLRGRKWLQKGLRVAADGVFGPQTVTAVRTIGGTDGVGVIKRACAARMGFLGGLRTWSTFGRGWARRVADTEASAVAMHTRSRSAVEIEAARADKVKQAQGTGAAATGGGGASAPMADLPGWGNEALIAVCVLVFVVLALKAVQNARRAAAYREKAVEMTNG